MNEEQDPEVSHENEIVIHKPGLCSNIKLNYRNFIELPLILNTVGVALFELIVPNAIELQYCVNVLNVTSTECSDSKSVHANAIQDFTSSFIMTRTIFEVFFSTLISIFAGPYSDSHGRKIFLLIPITGTLIMYALWTWASSAPFLKPIYFLLFSIPIAFFGNSYVFNFIVLCYVCDITSEVDRGFRLARIQAVTILSYMLSPALSLYANQYASSYTISFATATVLVGLSLAYTCFLIEESVSSDRRQLESNLDSPFSLNNLREVKIAFLRQTSNIRTTVILISLSYMIFLVVINGQSNIMFLVLQRLINIKLYDYTLLSMFYSFILLIGTLGCSWLFVSKLKINDLLLISSVIFLYLVSDIFFMFINKTWHVYFCFILSCPHGIADPLFKSYLSKIVDSNDLGKILSAFALSGSLAAIISTILYNQLYEFLLSIYPAAVFTLSALLMSVVLFLIAVLTKLHLQLNPYQKFTS